MVSIDKAAIVLTMAIVAIALGFTATGGSIQDAGGGDKMFNPQPEPPAKLEPKSSEGFGADLAILTIIDE